MPEISNQMVIDKNLCELIACRISEACKRFQETAGFWCDGVLPSEPESHYSPKYVNANRQIISKAFVGFDGQSGYKLIVNFGNKALSRHARDLDIKNCIPDLSQPRNFKIDRNKKAIVIQLF